MDSAVDLLAQRKFIESPYFLRTTYICTFIQPKILVTRTDAASDLCASIYKALCHVEPSIQLTVRPLWSKTFAKAQNYPKLSTLKYRKRVDIMVATMNIQL